MHAVIALMWTLILLVVTETKSYAQESSGQADQKKVAIVLTDTKEQVDPLYKEAKKRTLDKNLSERGAPRTQQHANEKKKGRNVTNLAYYPQTNEIRSFLISFVGTLFSLISFFIFFKRRKGIKDEK